MARIVTHSGICLPHAARARQALFAADADHPALANHRRSGGAVCGVRGGHLLLGDDDLGAVDGMPLTFGGSAAHNVQNVAAAALAAQGLGLSLSAIRSTLARFGLSPLDNPGRLERWTHRGATVLLDYAHNPDGLAQLLHVARALEPRRLGLLLGQAGNRDDAAVAALAATAAAARPDRVVVKELPAMLRGRALGEIPALLQRGLQAAGLAGPAFARIDDEEAAALALLAWAQPGDVLVLPVHTASVRRALQDFLVGPGAAPRR